MGKVYVLALRVVLRYECITRGNIQFVFVHTDLERQVTKEAV